MMNIVLPIIFIIFIVLIIMAGCRIKKNRIGKERRELEDQLRFPPGIKPSPDDVMKYLKAGNARFVAGKSLHPHMDANRIKMAGNESQNDYAYATIITCSDSRVPVELIFDAGVMDIFVIRVAGNVCDTTEVGSIEFGLSIVKTPVLVVLGHEQCGAVTAVTQVLFGEECKLERNIPPLLENIIPAVKKVMYDHPDIHGLDILPLAIEENVKQGIYNLFLKSPFTRDLFNKEEVKVAGAIYEVGTGIIRWMSEQIVEKIIKEVESDPL